MKSLEGETGCGRKIFLAWISCFSNSERACKLSGLIIIGNVEKSFIRQQGFPSRKLKMTKCSDFSKTKKMNCTNV